MRGESDFWARRRSKLRLCSSSSVRRVSVSGLEEVFWWPCVMEPPRRARAILRWMRMDRKA